MLVAGCEEVFKSSLLLSEILQRKLVLRLVVKDPLSVHHFKERPVAGLYCQLTDFDDVGGLVLPASGTGCEDVDYPLVSGTRHDYSSRYSCTRF